MAMFGWPPVDPAEQQRLAAMWGQQAMQPQPMPPAASTGMTPPTPMGPQATGMAPQSPAQSPPSFFGSLNPMVQSFGDRISANQNMLMGFAGGALNGQAGNLGAGFQGAMQGSVLDQARATKKKAEAEKLAQRQALANMGLTEQQVTGLGPEGAAEFWSKMQLKKMEGTGAVEPTAFMKDAQFLFPNDPAQQRAYLEQRSKLPQTQVSIHGQNALNDAGVKWYTKIQDEGDAAAASIPTIKGMKELVERDGFVQGPWVGPLANQVNQAWGAVTGQSDPKLADLGALRVARGGLIKDLLGGSFGPGYSEGDRKSIEVQVAAEDSGKAANLGSLDMLQKMQERKAIYAGMAENFIDENGKVDRAGYRKAITEYGLKNPMFATPVGPQNNPVSPNLSPVQGDPNKLIWRP